jgi:hypothetical protein
MAVRDSRILILCKTYPSPSAKYAETSCVAGMDETGALIRPYPVPFRLISDEAQFKKWQWIDAKVAKATDDHRPESHRLYTDTIKRDAEPLSTKGDWRDRKHAISGLAVYEDFGALELQRQTAKVTLGLVRPARIVALDITPAQSPEWSEEERKKLVQLQVQGGLFDDPEAKAITTLKKLPYDFHYRYECIVDGEARPYRHKIVDWEAGALFWNVYRHHGKAWEQPFRAKMEADLPSKDLMFLMGTIHRFPDQWLIVSLLYPPKVAPSLQGQLFG